MVWLFGAQLEGDLRDEQPEDRLSVTHDEQRTIDNLLGTAGVFLMTESAALGDQIATWRVVDPVEPEAWREVDELEQMRTALSQATAAGRALLVHVDRGTWQEARVGHAPLAVLDGDDTSEIVPGVVEVVAPCWHEPPPVPLTVFVVDEYSEPDVFPTVHKVRERVLNRLSGVYGKSTSLAVVVVAVDGRQTDPILLDVVHPACLSDTSDGLLEDRLRAAARRARTGDDSAETPQPQVLDRIEELVSALHSAVEALDPQQIILVSDAFLCIDSCADAIVDGPLPVASEFVDRMREAERLPHLRGRGLSLVTPRAPGAFVAYCAEVEWLVCEVGGILPNFPAARETDDAMPGAVVDTALARWAGPAPLPWPSREQQGSPSVKTVATVIECDTRPARRSLRLRAAVVSGSALSVCMSYAAGVHQSGFGILVMVMLIGATSLLLSKYFKSVPRVTSERPLVPARPELSRRATAGTGLPTRQARPIVDRDSGRVAVF